MPLGFDLTTFKPGLTLNLPESLQGFAQDFWQAHGIDQQQPILMVTIRTTWPDKNWEPENFGKALSSLPPHVQVVFCGSPGDEVFIKEAQAKMNRPGLSIAGQTSLLELAALLKTADLLLSCQNHCCHRLKADAL